MSNLKKSNKIISLFIFIFCITFCLGTVNLNNYFTLAENTVNLGTFVDLQEGLNKIYEQFGDIQNGEEIVVSKDDIVEVEGEKYLSLNSDDNEIKTMSASANSASNESLVELSSLEEEYEITENEDEIVLKQNDYTNRIIVYYEGQLESYKTDYYAEGQGWHIYQYTSREATEEAYNYYKNLPYVESVGYDDVIVATGHESYTGTLYNGYLSWGAVETGVDEYNAYLDLIESTSDLPTVYVAVLDSGVNTQHELLKDRIAFEYGKDFTGDADGLNGKEKYLFEDYSGHGSHTSGIIADQTKDNVKIVPLKVLKQNGKGTVSMIVNAINYVLYLNGEIAMVVDGEEQYIDTPLNIRVMNMSLGVESEDGSPVRNDSLTNAVNTAYNKGILSVVAAGNSSFDTSANCPANVDNAIVVSALNSDMRLASYSNTGSHVDFCAPGTSVVSSYRKVISGGKIDYNDYEPLSGTSMAAPHVTAVFALLFSTPSNAKKSNDELVNELIDHAQDLGTVGKDKYYGYGCITLSEFGVVTYGEVQFSNQEKNHESEFYLTLTYDSQYDYEIYYTLDETTPSANSYKYTEPIKISETTKVCAIAYAYSDVGVVGKSSISEFTYYFDNIDLDSNFEVSYNGIFGGGTITKYKGELTTLNIKSVVNGISISKIGDLAFSGSQVENVTLPNTCSEISEHAFYNLQTLKTISGQCVRIIDNYSFTNCSNLMEIYFPIALEVGVEAFRDCKSLTNIDLSYVGLINKYAFKGCSNINELIIPNCYSVQDGAFDGLNLATLQLSGNVNYFGVMSDFHAGKIITYLDTMFDSLYEEYSDEIVDLRVQLTNESATRKVFKTNEQENLVYQVYGGYISDMSYRCINVNDENNILELDYNTQEIDEYKQEITMILADLDVGKYEFTLYVTDYYGNEYISNTVEIVVFPENQTSYLLNLEGENYEVYVDGQLADEDFKLYSGIDYEIEVLPKTSYMVDQIEVDGVVKESSKFSLSNVTNDVNISCETAEIEYFNIKFTLSSGVHILVDGVEQPNEISIQRKNDLSFTIVCDEGYEINLIKINGVRQFIEQTFTIEDILQDYEIVVEAEKSKLMININYGNGGVVSSQGNLHEVGYGEDKIINITPENGYKIAKVLVNGKETVVNSDNTISLENITEDLNILVTFEPISSSVFGDNELTIIIFFSVFLGIALILIVSKTILYFVRKKKNNYKKHV